MHRLRREPALRMHCGPHPWREPRRRTPQAPGREWQSRAATVHAVL